MTKRKLTFEDSNAEKRARIDLTLVYDEDDMMDSLHRKFDQCNEDLPPLKRTKYWQTSPLVLQAKELKQEDTVVSKRCRDRPLIRIVVVRNAFKALWRERKQRRIQQQEREKLEREIAEQQINTNEGEDHEMEDIYSTFEELTNPMDYDLDSDLDSDL